MVHTIDITLPESVYVELQDVLEYTEKETPHPMAKFIFEALSQNRRAKKDLSLLGKIPYVKEGKDGLEEEKTAPLSVLKGAPKSDPDWKPEGATRKYPYKVGDRTHEALMYSCLLMVWRAKHSKKVPKFNSYQEALSTIVLGAAANKIMQAHQRDLQKEHDEIYSNDKPETKKPRAPARKRH